MVLFTDRPLDARGEAGPDAGEPGVQLDYVVEHGLPAQGLGELPGRQAHPPPGPGGLERVGQELTRIFREALTKVRRHAEARHVRVEFVPAPAELGPRERVPGS